jgi:microcystin-dependent protein
MFAHRSYNVAPDIIDAGQGGGGNITNLAMPIGSVIPFAGSTIPNKWLLCNGTEYNQAIADDLFDVIGYSYGVNPSATSIVQGSGGAIYGYDIATNTINFAGTNVVNTFIKVGTYIKLSGATATTGVNINGTIVLITTSNVAINGTGVGGVQYSGTFVNPLGSGVGGGSGMITTLNRFSVPVPDLRLASPIGAQTGTINLGTSGGSATTTLTITNLPPHSHTLWRGGAQANQGSTNADWIGSPNVDTGLAGGGNIYRATDTPATGTRVQQVGQDGTGQTAFSTRNPYVALNYIIHAKN